MFSSKLFCDSLTKNAGGRGAVKQWTIAVYVKMYLGPLIKTESCNIFPSALGLHYYEQGHFSKI